MLGFASEGQAVYPRPTPNHQATQERCPCWCRARQPWIYRKQAPAVYIPEIELCNSLGFLQREGGWYIHGPPDPAVYPWLPNKATPLSSLPEFRRRPPPEGTPVRYPSARLQADHG